MRILKDKPLSRYTYDVVNEILVTFLETLDQRRISFVSWEAWLNEALGN